MTHFLSSTCNLLPQNPHCLRAPLPQTHIVCVLALSSHTLHHYPYVACTQHGLWPALRAANTNICVQQFGSFRLHCSLSLSACAHSYSYRLHCSLPFPLLVHTVTVIGCIAASPSVLAHTVTALGCIAASPSHCLCTLTMHQHPALPPPPNSHVRKCTCLPVLAHSLYSNGLLCSLPIKLCVQ